MNERGDALRLVVSIILPKRNGEQHVSLFVRGSSLRLETCNDSRRSPRHEPWIWIDWRLAFKYLASLTLAPFRSITRRSFSSSRSTRA